MGTIFALLSAMAGSAKDLTSKHIAFSADGSTSAFASFLFAIPYYLLLLGILYIFGIEDFSYQSAFFVFVILRAVTDSVAEWCKMHAFEHGDISVVAPFLYLTPLFLLVTSPLITGDAITSNLVYAICLIVTGSILLATLSRDGDTQNFSLKGIGFAVCSAFFFSLNACFDRLAVQEASAALSGFMMTALSCFILAPTVWRHPKRIADLGNNRNSFLIRGFFEVVFMTLKLLALQYLSAPVVAGIAKISMLISICGGGMMFKEKRIVPKLLASLLILLGASWIIVSV